MRSADGGPERGVYRHPKPEPRHIWGTCVQLGVPFRDAATPPGCPSVGPPRVALVRTMASTLRSMDRTVARASLCPRSHILCSALIPFGRLRGEGRLLAFGLRCYTPRSPPSPLGPGGHFPFCRFLALIRRRDCDSNVVESGKNPPADRLPIVLPGTKEPRATGVKLRFDPTAGIPRFPGLRMPRIVLRLRSCFSSGHHCPRRVESELSTSKVRAGFGAPPDPTERSRVHSQPSEGDTPHGVKRWHQRGAIHRGKESEREPGRIGPVNLTRNPYHPEVDVVVEPSNGSRERRDSYLNNTGADERQKIFELRHALRMIASKSPAWAIKSSHFRAPKASDGGYKVRELSWGCLGPAVGFAAEDGLRTKARDQG